MKSRGGPGHTAILLALCTQWWSKAVSCPACETHPEQGHMRQEGCVLMWLLVCVHAEFSSQAKKMANVLSGALWQLISWPVGGIKPDEQSAVTMNAPITHNVAVVEWKHNHTRSGELWDVHGWIKCSKQQEGRDCFSPGRWHLYCGTITEWRTSSEDQMKTHPPPSHHKTTCFTPRKSGHWSKWGSKWRNMRPRFEPTATVTSINSQDNSSKGEKANKRYLLRHLDV